MSDYMKQRAYDKLYGKAEPEKKTKWLKRTRPKRVADKRVVENEIYLKRRNTYLANHKFCECGCGREATQVHHKRGRKGKYKGESLLIVVKFFMAVSDYCHKRIHRDVDKWATKKGYLLQRNTKSEKQPIMKRITLIFILSIFSCSLFSQTDKKADSIAKAQVEANKFIDSLTSKVTIKEFITWADDNVSAKYFREKPFSDLWNVFITSQYNLWIQSKKNIKPK